MHLSRSQLLRLQTFLISSSARRLASLALSYSVFLCFLKFATIHVLGCVGRPVKERKKSVVKKIRQFAKIREIDVTIRNYFLLVCQNRQVSYATPTITSLSRKESVIKKKEKKRVPTGICQGLGSSEGCHALPLPSPSLLVHLLFY